MKLSLRLIPSSDRNGKGEKHHPHSHPLNLHLVLKSSHTIVLCYPTPKFHTRYTIYLRPLPIPTPNSGNMAGFFHLANGEFAECAAMGNLVE